MKSRSSRKRLVIVVACVALLGITAHMANKNAIAVGPTAHSKLVYDPATLTLRKPTADRAEGAGGSLMTALPADAGDDVTELNQDAASSATSAGSSSCPNGTRATPAGCVLDSDLVISESLELQSLTRLNCRGHRTLPSSAGSGTTPESYLPSVPALAIAITGERGVEVHNCIIGEDGARFDFGIIAMNSKNAGKFGHRIHDNQVHARDSAITFLRVDDARANDNIITWTNGFGVWFARDSDRNRISSNIMSSPGAPPATIRELPGGRFRNDFGDNAIFVGDRHLEPLYNMVIGAQLYQFPNSEDGTYASQEDNVIEGNQLSLPGSSQGKSHAGILVSTNAKRSRVIANTVVEAGIGMRLAGERPAEVVSRAGRCTNAEGQATQRFCQTNADCFIPGIDAAPVGTCPVLVTDVRDLRARDTLVESNIFGGPFNSAQAAMRAAVFGGNGTVGGIIRGNQIYGTGIEAGITLAGNMIETGHVIGNVVQGVSFGLMLQQGSATSFGARVFLNDFTGSTMRAIGVFGPYTLSTELSWDGFGNYWGHTTPPCFKSSDTPFPVLIQDNNAFCVPVAAASSNSIRR